MIHNGCRGAFCLGSEIFPINPLLGYPFMVCNEANLDLFLSLEQKPVVSGLNELAVVRFAQLII